MAMSHNGEYRLSDSTAVEPLINSFAVWSDTISPAPYSLHLLHYQIKTLSSYIANPEIHIKAVQNPKFIGGPFINVPASRANEVKEILDRTEKDQKDNVEFAKAITEFYEYLAKEAKGQSLEPYYGNIPDPLRGYVELLYDYYSHPIVRLVESLLYESPYYKKQLQSLRLFHQPSDNFRRPFVSTPRLQEGDQIDWAVPFDSPDIDELFESRTCRPGRSGTCRSFSALTPKASNACCPCCRRTPTRRLKSGSARASGSAISGTPVYLWSGTASLC